MWSSGQIKYSPGRLYLPLSCDAYFCQGCDIGGTGWGLELLFIRHLFQCFPYILANEGEFMCVLALFNTRDLYFIHRRGLCLPSYSYLPLSLHPQACVFVFQNQHVHVRKGEKRSQTCRDERNYTNCYCGPCYNLHSFLSRDSSSCYDWTIGLELSPVSWLCTRVPLFTRQ